MSERQLEDSSHSCTVEHEGRPYEVRLYRFVGDPEWTLEVVDDEGTSLLFEDTFVSEEEAVEEAKVTIAETGINVYDPCEARLEQSFHELETQASSQALRTSPGFAFGRIVAAWTGTRTLEPEEVFAPLLRADASKEALQAAVLALADVEEAVAECLDSRRMPLEILGNRDALQEWAKGYMAVAIDDEAWFANRLCSRDLDTIAPIAAGDWPEDDVRAFDQVVAELSIAARLSFSTLLDASLSPPSSTFRREEPKVGRNDPCPCGSGKKFKKCCLRK